MVFSSNVFLFLFLPVFLAAYYLSPNIARVRNSVILAGSYAFYAWWRIDFLVLFTAVTAFNYFIGLEIARNGVKTQKSKRWLVLGVTVDLMTLGYFKYANFGVKSFNAGLAAANIGQFEMAHVILPIGISFYTFESISYIMDVYRGDTKPTRHPIDFATFVALFPHLIAGPIFRYKELADQFTEREHSFAIFGEGVQRFMIGFIRKVFIADTIAPVVTHCFGLMHPSTADAWLGAAAYTAQLYFDFSGYSDMAIGLGLMVGFRFTENFRRPYISQSITEFWRRWHISLSNWLRDYLYISLGGNRASSLKTYRNLFLTMLLGGLWHGANWTFVLWGTWHGTLLSIERRLGVKKPPTRFQIHRWLFTFLMVILGWVMFRADTVSDAIRMYAAMFRFDGQGLGSATVGSVSHLQIAMMILAFVVVLMEILQEYRPRGRPLFQVQQPLLAFSLIFPMFLLSVLKLSADSFSPFLYFQF